jgi:hypothetical protein
MIVKKRFFPATIFNRVMSLCYKFYCSSGGISVRGHILVYIITCWASVRLLHARTWFRLSVAKQFATDRSNATTHRVLILVNCLYIVSILKLIILLPMLSFPVSFLAVEVVSSGCGHS